MWHNRGMKKIYDKNLINKVKEEVKNKKNIDLELEQIIVKWWNNGKKGKNETK